MKWWPNAIVYRNPTGTPKMNLLECDEVIKSFIDKNISFLPENLVLRAKEVFPIFIVVYIVSINNIDLLFYF